MINDPDNHFESGVRPLLVLTAFDGSSLVLSQTPDGLVFEHNGHTERGAR